MPPSASHPACTGDRHLRRYVDVDTMHAHGHAYTHACTSAYARIIRMDGRTDGRTYIHTYNTTPPP